MKRLIPIIPVLVFVLILGFTPACKAIPEPEELFEACAKGDLEEAERITRQNGTQIYSKMMGKWLKEEFGEMLYTIGTFSYRGSVYAGQGIYPEGIIQIDITLTNSLEAILYNTRKRYCYFDLSLDG